MTRRILTCEQVRAAEASAAASGVSLWTLMQRAGAACADVLHAAYPEGEVVVLAGPGNNGGDARVAAMRLVDLGRTVRLYATPASASPPPEAAAASAAFDRPAMPLEDLRIALSDVVLDGLFGAGLSRPLEGASAFAVQAALASGARIVAIDVPSGVRGDRGVLDTLALRADMTVTFGCKKPAHVLQPAAGACGEVVVAEIGFGRFLEQASPTPLEENGPELWAGALRWPDAMTHKHDRGRLCVVSGGLARTGAARLAARAGLRAGAGVATLLCPPSALVVAAQAMTAVMTEAFSGPEDLVKRTERASAVVIGPAAGVDAATRAGVEALARAGRRLVLDADALSVFASDASGLAAVLAVGAGLGGCAVLTPHAGEFERLFPGLLADAPDRIAAVRAAAARAGAVVLLKGADTVIAGPDGRAVVNTHATPFLATAGAGDVLAGVIGGLLAQGLSPFDAACAGAWLHGDAGRRSGPGLIAEDLDQGLRESLRGLHGRGRAGGG